MIVTRPGTALDEAAVVDACLARLASYKKPRLVEFVESLPKTGSGKSMRRSVRDRYWTDRERAVGG